MRLCGDVAGVAAVWKALIAPPRPGELALTFDDGPNPAWTPRLLEVLVSHEVRATFFLVGSHAQAEPELVRRIVAGGHLIGNHSWSHPNLALTSAPGLSEELAQDQRNAGADCRCASEVFSSAVRCAAAGGVSHGARSWGWFRCLWNAMTSDWREPSADAIAVRLTGTIDRLQQRGWAANIVLHDGDHRGSRRLSRARR